MDVLATAPDVSYLSYEFAISEVLPRGSTSYHRIAYTKAEQETVKSSLVTVIVRPTFNTQLSKASRAQESTVRFPRTQPSSTSPFHLLKQQQPKPPSPSLQSQGTQPQA